MSIRTRLARTILRLAEIAATHLDRREVPKFSGYTYTYERGRGAVLRMDGKGTRVLYLNDAEYDRAWSESDTYLPTHEGLAR